MNSLSQFPAPLLAWYQHNARALPWRQSPTPYRVWVSEIMLQQTRVGAVLGYFSRFMETFPTVADLAQAPEDLLMKQWQGLGYYSRARNLQKAAKQIMTDFGGEFPRAYEDIRSLAGVGDYTAGAIASIAFGLPVPAVDGNLLRVTARLTGDFTDITTPGMKKKVTAALQKVIPPEAPGAFNQAMMDLGATICLPNGAPLCEDCPVQAVCAAYQNNQTNLLPVRKPKAPRQLISRQVFLLFYEGKVALRRRPSKGLLAGLWEYPGEDEDPRAGYLSQWDITPLREEDGPKAKHIFTHVEWHMTPHLIWVANDRLPTGWVWADRVALEREYAIPSALRPFASLVDRGLWESLHREEWEDSHGLD